MANKNDKLVIGYYANEAAAHAAANEIKDWDEWDKDIKLGAIAILYIDRNSGELRADEVGARTTGKGALWGTAIGAAAGILTAGIALVPGMIVGATLGGGAGALNHKSIGMSDEQREKLVQDLKHGGAALGVMADDFEVEAVKDKMVSGGGVVEQYDVPEETAEAILAAADAQAEAVEAVDANTVVVEEEVVVASRAIEVDIPDIDPAEVEGVSKLVATTGMSTYTAAKLYEAGADKASALISMAATKEGRAALAEQTGVDSDKILYEAKKLDLMRVKGIGYKYATLLLAAGVDTVPELATRNPANLAAKCAEVNEVEGIVDELPSEKMTADWVAQAKELPRMLYY